MEHMKEYILIKYAGMRDDECHEEFQTLEELEEVFLQNLKENVGGEMIPCKRLGVKIIEDK